MPTSIPGPTTTSSKVTQPIGSPSVVSGTIDSNVRQKTEHPSAAVVAEGAVAAVIGTVILCAFLVLVQRRRARRQQQSECAEVTQSRLDEPNVEREKALVHELSGKEILRFELDATTIAGSPLQGNI